MENKIITKEEYLQAVQIVEIYHDQVSKKISLVKSFTKYSMSQFLKEYDHRITKRLGNALYNYLRENQEYREICISKFHSYFLKKQRDVGKLTLEEFDKIRLEVIQEKNIIL